MNEKTRNILIIYLLAALPIAVYFPILSHGVIHWGDDELFTAAKEARSIGALFSSSEFAPLVVAIAKGEYLIGGNGMFLTHLISILLHAANGILIFFILNRWAGEFRVALTASLLFLLHPIQVVSVAWIAQQQVLVPTFFLLSAFLFYDTFVRGGRRSWYWIALGCSVVYSLSSPPGFALLGASVLAEWGVNKKFRWRNELLPFVLLPILALMWSQSGAPLGRTLTNIMDGSTAIMRFGIPYGIAEFALPLSSHFFSPIDALKNLFAGFGGIILPFISVLLVAVALARAGRSRWATGFLIFILFSLPVFHGRGVGDGLIVHSHFYLSSIGLCIVAANVWEFVLRKVKNSVPVTRLVAVGGIVVLLLLSITARIDSSAWESDLALWKLKVNEYGRDLFSLNKLGLAYYSETRFDKALSTFDSALAISPGNIQSVFYRGYVKLGTFDLTGAADDFRSVLARDSMHTLACFNLGIIFSYYGETDSAVRYFSRALQWNPLFQQAYRARGNAYARGGNYIASLADYDRALAINPDFANVYGDRGLILLQIGRPKEALTDFEHQLSLSPYRADAAIKAGLTAILMRDTSRAVGYIARGRSIDSQTAESYLATASKTFLTSPGDRRFGSWVLERARRR